MKIKVPQKFKLSTLLYNKKFTAVLSVVLAFALWLGIAMTENTVRKESFKNLSATVSLDGTAAEKLGLGIFSDVSSQKFTVTVEGPNHIVSSLKADDFKLTASTLEINSAKTYNLAIGVENTSVKSGYTVVSIEPATIEVAVDYMDTNEFEVEPKLIGAQAGDNFVWENEDINFADSNNKITIKGPRSKIGKIRKVYAVAEVNDTLTESKTFDANIVLCDEDDKELYHFSSDGTMWDAYNNPVVNSYIEVSFKNTKLSVSVDKQKIIKCEPVFTNMPEGLTLEDVKFTISANTGTDSDIVTEKLNDNEIIIKGDPTTIDNIEKLLLKPIDFRELSRSGNSFEVTHQDLPQGVEIVGDINFFTVDVNMSGYSEKSVTINSFEYIGLGNYTAKADKENITIRICGPSAQINKIRAKDIQLVFDLTGKTAGKYEVIPQLKSDEYNSVWQVGKNEIFVTVN